MAIVSFTVYIVTLAVLPKDYSVGVVTGMALTPPTDTVSQSRAHKGAVVFLAASLQFLAALAVCLALTVFPCVAKVAPVAI